MSLGPKEFSGTPMETRDATSTAAGVFRNLFGGNVGAFGNFADALGEGMGRATSSSAAQMMGFSPETLNLGPRLDTLLASPEEQTFDLFNAMQPFEDRQVRQNVGDIREAFGTAGARFSPNLLTAETELRGELSNQFGRRRSEELLGARDRQNQAMSTILSAMVGSQDIASRNITGPLQAILSFLNPGGPAIDPGILSGLIGAAGTIGGAKLMR